MVYVFYKYICTIYIIHSNTLSNTTGIQLFDAIFADTPKVSIS